jgi:hypothetical protein
MIKSIIKNKIKQNSYTFEAALRVRFYRRNRQLLRWSRASESLDLLEADDLEVLKNLGLTTSSARTNSLLLYSSTCMEAMHYCYGTALLSYVVARPRELFYIPGVMHGADFYFQFRMPQ